MTARQKIDIADLKSRISVSQVAAMNGIALRKKGREFQALCPFHNERTPSFTVNDEKGFYHCFGCGAHGDQIALDMALTRRSFIDTAKALAGRIDLAAPIIRRPDPTQETDTDKINFARSIWSAAETIEGGAA
jgi:DNA primase